MNTRLSWLTIAGRQALGLLLTCLLPLLSHAQLVLTGPAPVTTSFDGLGPSATAALPDGFVISNAGATGITYTAPGNTTATTAAAGTSGTNALASNSSGGAYNLAPGATAMATDRALGFLATGTYTAPRHLLLAVQNNTGATITDLAVAYDVEKYRDGTRSFEWQLYTSTDGTAWTPLPALTASYAAGPANAVSNPPTSLGRTVTLTGLNLVGGATTYLRWSYVGSGGSTNAQALALDNLVLTPTLGAAAAPQLTLTPRPVPDFGSVYVGTASPSQALTISGSNLTAPVILTPPPGFELRLGDEAFACCALTLNPRNGTVAPTTVDVRFVPALAQGYTGGISVSTADRPGELPVPVSGTGVLPVVPAAVRSSAASAITATSATAGGTVDSDGGGPVTERGVVVGLHPYPTVADSLTVDGAGPGAFTSALTGLQPGRRYYLRAYATNTEGTVYGELLTFTTPAPSGQLLLTENFAYPSGDRLTAHGWTAHSAAGTNPILVASAGLTRSDYPVSGGYAAALTASGEDVNRTFPAVSADQRPVYAALLVQVNTANAADYFFHLGPDPLGTTFRARVFVRAAPTAGLVQFGVGSSGSSSTPVFAPAEYPLGTPVLLVVRYTFGAAGAETSLFLNPGATEPGTADATIAEPASAVPTNIGAVALRQGSNTSPLVVDGLRVATSYALARPSGAPLPVELTAFTATLVRDAAVRLDWATASEKNSQLFDVERSLDGMAFAAIGTVAAAGNSSSSSSAHRYELLDAKLPASAALLYYRLKQADLDGTFSYSSVRTVALSGAAAGLSIYPNPAHGAATLTGATPSTVVMVYDALGRPVTSATADASGTAALVMPQGMAIGVYVVRVGSKALRLTVE